MPDAPEKDWGSEESGIEEVTEATPQTAAPSPPPAPTAPQPQVQQVPPPAPEPDNFPTSLKECQEMLKEGARYARLGDKPTSEQRANHAKYQRLRKHYYDLQQATKAVHTDAHSKHAFIGISPERLEGTRLALLARTNPTVKKLIAERDALLEANKKLAQENAELNELLKQAK